MTTIRRKCVSCEDPFTTAETGLSALSAFCWTCRKGFGMETEADAEELLAMFDMDILQLKDGGFKLVEGTVKKKDEKEKPKVDPEVVAAGIRTQVDYKISPVKEYKKAITYVCYKNGLFEVRHSDLATIITKPKKVLGLTEEAKEGMTLNLPKLPFLFLQQTISFFRGVEGKMKGSSEALVQIWWDRTEKQHVIHVPEQQVSGGSVRHASVFDQDSTGRYFHVADIHSHGSGMSAFWSGVDDADEKRVTTERLFGVIGRVSKPVPEWKWRMRTRDGFIDLNVADVFEMPRENFSFTVKAEDLFRSMGSESTFKDGKVSLWCPVDPFENVEIPAEWYEQVKSYSHNTNTGFGWNGHAWNNKQTGNVIKGFIYVDGIEYEVEGSTLKPTGHKLMRKAEDHGRLNNTNA